jgi:alcohol oxidase
VTKAILQLIGLTNVISDLPPVGQNLQHLEISCNVIQVNTGPNNASDDLVLDKPKIVEKVKKDYEQGRGLLATNFVDAAIKWRPSPDEVKQTGGDFEQHWNAYFASKPDKPVVLSLLIACRPDGLGLLTPFYKQILI